MGPEARRRLYHYFVIFCGEFIGTAFLMIYGCTGINDKELDGTHAAVAWAFVVTAVITAFGHITHCHINPSVTICLVILGLVKPFSALIYFAAEMLGAIFGFYVVLVLTQNILLTKVTNPDGAFCMTTIAPEIEVSHGFLCEFLATSFLIFVVCSITDRRNTMWGDSIAIKVGFTVGILVYGAGPLTGASMNPARSFAPALLYGKWKNHWVYWVATLGGSIFTSLLYKYLFLASVEDEVMIKVVARPSGSDAMNQGVLVADAYDTESGTSKVESFDVSPRLETETAIQKDTAFVSNILH